MERKTKKGILSGAVLALMATATPTAAAQTTSALVVAVEASTGVSVQGIPVELYGEDSGWVFDPVKANAEGFARFSYVPEGVFTLTVDGSALGLEKYVNDSIVHTVTAGVTDTVRVSLGEAVRTPYALTAALAHDDFTGENTVTVSWNRETDYFFDDFESYEPFAIDFAPWTGHDLDKEPAAEITGSYPNRGLQQYATIFNALTIDPPVYYEYEVLRPYSGKQFVGFVRTRSGNANNDWLISPKIKVGVNNIVSFMAKASEYQPDRFAVCISTTGTDTKDFVQLTPGNYQTVDYRGWQEISYNLAAYEGKEVYIAIHCMSQNSFMLMIDDFYVGPSEIPVPERKPSLRSAGNPNEKFIVSVDGTQVGETEEYSYTFDDLTAGSHTVGITAKYLQTQSEEATIEVEVPADSAFASVTINLKADNGESLENQEVNALNVATAKLTTAAADKDGTVVIGSLAKGKYMINVASEIFEEYNATIELTADTVIEVTLSETITDPYNVIYESTENEDGTRDFEFWWNRDLGFSDSFEDYDDFVQAFGDWTVIDGDKMPTYAFSVSGVVIERPETRGEVGAMIFNPYATEPVKASDDGLFIAPDGDKYVMFNSAEAAKSDDWLITPEVKIGADYVLRFTAKSYDMYVGTFEICVLADGDVTKATVLDAITLSSDWMRYEVSLQAYEGRNIKVGFHHITHDGWLSFIDDVYIGPGKETTGQAVGNCTFDIWLDEEFHSNVSEPYVKFEKLAPGSHKAGIQAVYASGKKSAVTEVSFAVESGVADAILDGNMAEEGPWKIYNLNGVELDAANLPAGIYIRSNGARTEKVVVR